MKKDFRIELPAIKNLKHSVKNTENNKKKLSKHLTLQHILQQREMKKINLKMYYETPARYEIRKVSELKDIPRGLVTKTSKWVGYDLEDDCYAKFSKTVFTKLIADKKVKTEK